LDNIIAWRVQRQSFIYLPRKIVRQRKFLTSKTKQGFILNDFSISFSFIANVFELPYNQIEFHQLIKKNIREKKLQKLKHRPVSKNRRHATTRATRTSHTAEVFGNSRSTLPPTTTRVVSAVLTTSRLKRCLRKLLASFVSNLTSRAANETRYDPTGQFCETSETVIKTKCRIKINLTFKQKELLNVLRFNFRIRLNC
jgi:hypothetical protein